MCLSSLSNRKRYRAHHRELNDEFEELEIDKETNNDPEMEDEIIRRQAEITRTIDMIHDKLEHTDH